MAITQRTVRKATRKVVKGSKAAKIDLAARSERAVQRVKDAVGDTRDKLRIAGRRIRRAVVEASHDPDVRRAAAAAVVVGTAITVGVAAKKLTKK
jgi:hypothetical protein